MVDVYPSTVSSPCLSPLGYTDFLATKLLVDIPTGLDVPIVTLPAVLFDWQAAMVHWALQRGRAAFFWGTGTGKTLAQLAWAAQVPGQVLIFAPLGVTHQTIAEAQDKLGLMTQYVRRPAEMATQICITNYDLLEHFCDIDMQGIVLDESSCLKGITSVRRKLFFDHFTHIPFRLCCTATPAPNDIAELAMTAEFLGVMTRAAMLATFFVHRDTGWSLMAHAAVPFYRWLASWAMAMRSPADLGYDGSAFVLPPLMLTEHFLPWDGARLLADGEGQMGIPGTQKLHGIGDRIAIRQQTVSLRAEHAATMIRDALRREKLSKWVVWCGLDEEQHLMAKLLGDDCVSIYGSLAPEEKLQRERAWREGAVPVIVTKAKIFGWGINWQCCHQAVFLGMNDSMELFYQAVRRLWRYGQTQPVTTHIVLSEHERPIWDNVQRKEREAMTMIDGLIEAVKGYEQETLGGQNAKADTPVIAEAYNDSYHVWHGDSCEILSSLQPDTWGLAVFSPPFSNLYVYNDSERDIGNCRSEAEFFRHFGFLADALLRVLMPGRLVAMHLSEIPAMLVRDGWIGMHNFIGHMKDHMTGHGWINHGEVVITKNPQAQSVRLHPKGLSFTQLRKDASWMRPALVDHILLFRKPGDNPTNIISDVDNNTWIKWANGVWYGLHDEPNGIRETHTLNAAEGRDNDDTKHIAPLQLSVIERCIRLWSNKNDIIGSPCMGIGSEGFVALQYGRRFEGIELKESYFHCAIKNLERAMTLQTQIALF